MDIYFADRGTEEIIDRDHLIKRIERGEKLRIKYGVDPTSADIHLGHAVTLMKLKEFQLRGHKVVIIIGDYTARIGDPSGRNKTRPMLEEKEIETNAKTYLKQIGRVLDMKEVEVQRNSKWFGKMSFGDLMKLLSNFTAAQILERDDFNNRIKKGEDVGLHELLYPVMQAYDSVMVKADVEVGGTDQKFNLMAGRDLQKKMGQKPQDIITVPLLVGTDGKEKMSKSLGNAIGIAEEPKDIYGKVMSIPDELVLSYFELATDLSAGGLTIIKKELEEGANLREVKARLAYLIVELYYNTEQAEEAADYFNLTVRDKQVPKDIPIIKLARKERGILVDLLVKYKIVKSKSEVKRLIEQSGLKFDGKIETKAEREVVFDDGLVIQIGKRRYYKLKLAKSIRRSLFKIK